MIPSQLVESLAAVCRDRLLDEKWLIAPSLRVGHQWLDAVARTGQGAVNVHVKTFRSLAMELAAPLMAARGGRLLAGQAGPMVMQRVFHHLRSEGLEYLGGLKAELGLAAVLFRSIQALRLAGLAEPSLEDECFEVAAKASDVRRLLAAYVRTIRDLGLLDYPDVLRLAIDRISGTDPQQASAPQEVQRPTGACGSSGAVAPNRPAALPPSAGNPQDLRVSREVQRPTGAGGSSGAVAPNRPAALPPSAGNPQDLRVPREVQRPTGAGGSSGAVAPNRPAALPPSAGNPQDLRVSREVQRPTGAGGSSGAVAPSRSAALPPLPPCLLCPADLRLSGLELQLLESFPASQRHTLSVDQPIDEMAAASPAMSDIERLKWMARPSEAPPPLRDDSVGLYHAVGEVNEVREALRRLMVREIPFDQVEILHTDPGVYVPLVQETLAALVPESENGDGELPVTFAEGLPCSYFRPGRLLKAWCRWVGEDFLQTHLVEMIREGLLELPQPSAKELSHSRLAIRLRDLRIGLGRDRYLRRIDEEIVASHHRALQSHRDESLDGEDAGKPDVHGRRLEELQTLRQAVAALLDASPDRHRRATEILFGAERLIESLARTANKSDNYARMRLLIDVREMRRWLTEDEDAIEFDVWAWLAELPNQSRVLGSGPREGRLHVAGLFSGGHAGRSNTILLGLDDGRFPGGGSQDPLLLDSERHRLSDRLPTAASDLESRLQDFRRLLARLRGRVTMSFSSFDLVEGRARFPSSAFQDAFRIVSGKTDGSQEDCMEWLGSAASFAPAGDDRCLSVQEWWLRTLCIGDPPVNSLEVVFREFPHLASGEEATRCRLSKEFTPFDGFVPEAGADLDPSQGDDRVLSSGRLETLGQCPCRYFFRYVLDVEPPPNLDVDVDRWLDPLATGKLMHTVFERFLRERIAAGVLPTYPDHLPQLTAVLDATIEEFRRDDPPPSELTFQTQRSELERMARTFLVSEHHFCREASSRPAYVEASLGMVNRDGIRSPIDVDEPIRVDLDEGVAIHVRGRVDRIDATGQGTTEAYTVWDYKTGSAGRYNPSDPFQQGRIVQPAIYIAMAERALRKAMKRSVRVAGFGFLFPGPRERGRRIQWSANQLEVEGRRIVSQLIELVRRGAFAPTDQSQDCRYCDYSRVCGDVVALTTAASGKLASAENEVLKPWRELRSDGQTKSE